MQARGQVGSFLPQHLAIRAHSHCSLLMQLDTLSFPPTRHWQSIFPLLRKVEILKALPAGCAAAPLLYFITRPSRRLQFMSQMACAMYHGGADRTLDVLAWTTTAAVCYAMHT